MKALLCWFGWHKYPTRPSSSTFIYDVWVCTRCLNVKTRER